MAQPSSESSGGLNVGRRIMARRMTIVQVANRPPSSPGGVQTFTPMTITNITPTDEPRKVTISLKRLSDSAMSAATSSLDGDVGPKPIILNFSNGMQKVNIITAKTIHNFNGKSSPAAPVKPATVNSDALRMAPAASARSVVPSLVRLIPTRPANLTEHPVVSSPEKPQNNSGLKIQPVVKIRPAVQTQPIGQSSPVVRSQPIAHSTPAAQHKPEAVAESPPAVQVKPTKAVAAQSPSNRSSAQPVSSAVARRTDAVRQSVSSARPVQRRTRRQKDWREFRDSAIPRVKMYVCGICNTHHKDMDRFKQHCRVLHVLPSPAQSTAESQLGVNQSPNANQTTSEHASVAKQQLARLSRSEREPRAETDDDDASIDYEPGSHEPEVIIHQQDSDDSASEEDDFPAGYSLQNDQPVKLKQGNNARNGAEAYSEDDDDDDSCVEIFGEPDVVVIESSDDESDRINATSRARIGLDV